MQDNLMSSKNIDNSNQWLSIRASAGSGKTFSLTLRFIYLLFSGAKPNEILTLTFTHKAQQEMQERILRTLRDLSQNTNISKDNPYILELHNLGLSIQDIQNNSKNIYLQFLRSNNHIMTFDAFFNMVLRKFSFYAGLLNNYELGKNFNHDKDALNQALDNFNEKKHVEFKQFISFCAINNLDTKKILKMLNEVKVDDYHTTINHPKMGYAGIIIENYNEIKEYVLNLIDGVEKVTNIQKRFSKNISKNSTIRDLLELIDTKEKTILLTPTMIKKLVKLNYDKSFYNQRILKISQAFNAYFNDNENLILNTIIKFYKLYINNKLNIARNKNKLTFSDLNLFCYDLLRNNIDSEFFYFRLDSKINHILIDEFQDTNINQYMILERLIDEIKSGVGRISERSLFFVGDEKQAIYSFRGSDSRLFEAISKSLDMNIKSLPKNYRSAKNIVEFVNNIFRKEFKDYEIQIPDRKNDGFVKVITKEKHEILACIKERIEFLLKHNRKDIMILTRKNDDAIEIKNYLLKEIPNLKIAVYDNKNKDSLIISNALQYMQTRNILYLKNALKLNGDSYFMDLNMDLNSSMMPSEVILRIMKIFNLYSKTAISILEQSLNFNSLDDFIDEFKDIDVDIDESKECDIRISSIHKSKGLEFEDVILCEYSAESQDKDSLHYSYDGIELKQITYLKDSMLRKVVDLEFDKIYNQRKDEQHLDSINLLYVAFTRAKESLFIIKHEKNNLYNKIELKDTTIGDELYFNTPEIRESKEIKTPSLIEQQTFGKQDDFFIQDNNKQYDLISKIKGLALHLVMEHTLKYQDCLEIENILINKYGLILDKSQIEKILQSAKKILNNETIKMILSSNPSIKCEVSYIDKNKTIHRIDCILETDKTVFILDYKSSNLDLEKKQNQVREYLDFIKTLYKNKIVEAYLCFADGEISKV